jgi:hypothetical protein
MKAKNLIKLLEQFPEAEVLISVYTGSDTPVVDVEATLIQKGGVIPSFDGSMTSLVNKKTGITKCDVIFISEKQD